MPQTAFGSCVSGRTLGSFRLDALQVRDSPVLLGGQAGLTRASSAALENKGAGLAFKFGFFRALSWIVIRGPVTAATRRQAPALSFPEGHQRGRSPGSARLRLISGFIRFGH